MLLSAAAGRALLGYNPVSDRILVAKFQTKYVNLVILQVYAPTSTAPRQDVDQFYDNLQQTVQDHSGGNFPIVMGDFNAKVGDDWENAGGALGHLVHLLFQTSQGERLIHFANVNDLVVTNTCFKQVRSRRLWTPDHRTRNMIDHILVNKKWRGSVTNSRVYPSADVGSDHQLLQVSIRLKLKAGKRLTAVKRYNVETLSDQVVADQYRITVGDRLESVADFSSSNRADVNDMWDIIADAYNTTARDVLGFAQKRPEKKVDLSSETLELADQRKRLKAYKRESVTVAKQ